MRIVVLEPLLISDDTLEKFKNTFREMGHEIIFYNDRVEDPITLKERSQDAEVLVLANIPFPGEVIKACPHLKMISVAFTGVDHIDMETCRNKNITVCNAAGYSNFSVAELVFGMLISLIRNIISCNEVIREEKTKDGLVGHELYGKTLGLVGTGSIALHVAKIANALGLKLLAYSRSERKEFKNLGAKYVDLDTLLSESDVVTLHTPLTKETQGLIDKERLAKMKPTAILINTARGPVVDSLALAEALKSGKIGGAAVDVFEMEPPIPADHPLMSAPNCLLTPHVAFATWEAFERRAEIVFDNIISWLEGNPKNLIN